MMIRAYRIEKSGMSLFFSIFVKIWKLEYDCGIILPKEFGDIVVELRKEMERKNVLKSNLF